MDGIRYFISYKTVLVYYFRGCRKKKLYELLFLNTCFRENYDMTAGKSYGFNLNLYNIQSIYLSSHILCRFLETSV